MIRKLSGYIESKTGVYVYPRFVISMLALGLTVVLSSAVFFAIHRYRESIKTIGPDAGATSEGYEARMRAGVRPPAINP